jgi:thiosulfate/3-mercaptopyruvate sulfurtransferase
VVSESPDFGAPLTTHKRLTGLRRLHLLEPEFLVHLFWIPLHLCNLLSLYLCMAKISPIIDPEEFLLLSSTKEIVLVDARTGPDAKTRYLNEHLDGALFVDLDTQLANIPADAANGGRHPLPDIKVFAKALHSLGIMPDTHVVIYDDKNGSNAAARFWWMLRSIGHKTARVLNGGLAAAINAGVPVSSKEEIPVTRGIYPVSNWQLPLATMAEVEKAAANDNYLVIDVRDKERFDGDKEPIDKIAGHIPGAMNIPFVSNLDAGGLYLSPEKLKEKYLQSFSGVKTGNIIVHCGSGITACHTLLALDYAGFEIPKLYVGSWSEWSNSGRPIATRKQD